MARVGVIADTHCPEYLDSLPPALFDRLAGVDLILHAGDVGSLDTIRQLERIAPVHAVRGDHDGGLDQLPRELTIEVGGRRLTAVHGNRSRLLEEPVTLVGTVSLGYLWPKPGLHRHLVHRFPDSDVIVYGHTHAAAIQRLGSKLLFNPGAVYQVTPEAARRRLERGPGWFEWSWLQVARHRRRLPLASVGVLEISKAGVTALVMPLS